MQTLSSCFSFCSYSEHPCLNLDVSNGGKYLIKILCCKKQSALHYDYLFLFISFRYRTIVEDVSVPQMHFEDGWLQTHISYPEPFIIYYI